MWARRLDEGWDLRKARSGSQAGLTPHLMPSFAWASIPLPHAPIPCVAFGVPSDPPISFCFLGSDCSPASPQVGGGLGCFNV